MRSLPLAGNNALHGDEDDEAQEIDREEARIGKGTRGGDEARDQARPAGSDAAATGWRHYRATHEGAGLAGCPYHLSHPGVLMMKSAEEGNGHDRSDSLHWPA